MLVLIYQTGLAHAFTAQAFASWDAGGRAIVRPGRTPRLTSLDQCCSHPPLRC